jgi:hypothetical protein
MLAAAFEGLDSDPLTSFLGRELIWLLSQPLFWAILGVVIGPFLFYRGFRLLQRKRLILDIRRSTIRAAAIGPVEVSGKAVGPYTLISPLSKRECLYYRVVVRAQRQAASAYSTYSWDRDLALFAFCFGFLRQTFKKNSGQLIDELCAPLFLDDGTGELMVYPKSADMQLTRHEGSGGDYLARVLSRHGFARDDFQAAEEYCILPNDDIFIVGTLCENPWANKKSDRAKGELSRIGPGFVSFDEAELCRREAFTYLDSTLPSGAAQAHQFNLYPSTILMHGQCPFVISNNSQRQVVSQLSWKSLLFIWGGPIWALWAVWEILGHPELWGVLLQTPK